MKLRKRLTAHQMRSARSTPVMRRRPVLDVLEDRRMLTAFTMESPTRGGLLPAAVSPVGGVVLDLVGLSGRRIITQTSAVRLFQGFFDSGSPAEYQGNPGTIGIRTGFTPELVAALGGGLAELAVRLTVLDGDTGPGDFDQGDNTLWLNGVEVGGFSAVRTEETSSDGLSALSTSPGGFRDDRLDTGFFHVTDPTVLGAVFTSLAQTGQVVYQLHDREPFDNLFDFTAGVSGDLTGADQPPIVVNAPPQIDRLAVATPVLEGRLATFTVTAHDPDGAGQPLLYRYDFNGDGKDDLVTAASTASTTYARDGSYTARVTVVDAEGKAATDTLAVVVENVAPTVNRPADQTAREGTAASFNLGSFADPGQDGPWLVRLDWGDGSPPETFSLAQPGPIGVRGHTFAQDGPQTVRVSVSDDDTTRETSFLVTVANAAPEVTPSPDQAALEGTPSSFGLGGFFDPGRTDGPWRVTVDWGDGTAPETFEASQVGSLRSRSHTYARDGVFRVQLAVADDDASGAGSFLVRVANAAPAILPAADQVAREGHEARLALGQLVDPGADGPWLVTVDWGDGSPPETFSVDPAGGLGALSTRPVAGFGVLQQTYVIGSPSGFRSSFLQAADPGALGGFQDFYLARTSDNGGFVSAGTDPTSPMAFAFGTGPATAGWASIQLDGDDDSPTIQPDGLGGLSLLVPGATAHWLRIPVVADLASDIIVNVWSGAGNQSTARLIIPADPSFSLADYLLPFDAFTVVSGTGADFGAVGAIEILVGTRDGAPVSGLDLALGRITAEGTTATAAGDLGIRTHTYAQDGAFPVTVRVSDGAAEVAAAFAVAVENVAPAVVTPADQAAREGTTAAFDLGAFDDPGRDGPWALVLDWGDGSPPTAFTLAAPGAIPLQAHTYAQDGAYRATLSVADDDTSRLVTWTIAVDNVAPAIAAPTDQAVDEGTNAVFDLGSFTDPGADGPWTATLDWGDGSPVIPFALGAVGAIGQILHAYAQDGNYRATLTVADDDVSRQVAWSVVVANVAPTVNRPSDQSAREGTTAAFDLGAFDDPGQDGPWTLLLDWGDGSPPVAFTLAAPGAIPLQAHAYAQDGAYRATLSVADDDTSRPVAWTIAVDNVAPAIRRLVLLPDRLGVGQTATLTVEFDDPGRADVLTLVVDPGNGETVTYILGAASDRFEARIDGALPGGSRTLTAILSDDGGASDRSQAAYQVAGPDRTELAPDVLIAVGPEPTLSNSLPAADPDTGGDSPPPNPAGLPASIALQQGQNASGPGLPGPGLDEGGAATSTEAPPEAPAAAPAPPAPETPAAAGGDSAPVAAPAPPAPSGDPATLIAGNDVTMNATAAATAATATAPAASAAPASTAGSSSEAPAEPRRVGGQAILAVIAILTMRRSQGRSRSRSRMARRLHGRRSAPPSPAQ